jgi:hypothetical protein
MTLLTKRSLAVAVLLGPTAAFLLLCGSPQQPVASAKPVLRDAPKHSSKTVPAMQDEPEEKPQLPPISVEVQRQVEACLRLHGGQSIGDLTNMNKPGFDAEFVARKDKVFGAAYKDPANAQRIEEAVVTLTAMKRSSTLVSIDLLRVDSPAGRSFLEVIYSGEPDRAIAWAERMLGSAIFETAFDPQASQTTDGLRIKTAPASSAAASEEKD